MDEFIGSLTEAGQKFTVRHWAGDGSESCFKPLDMVQKNAWSAPEELGMREIIKRIGVKGVGDGVLDLINTYNASPGAWIAFSHDEGWKERVKPSDTAAFAQCFAQDGTWLGALNSESVFITAKEAEEAADREDAEEEEAWENSMEKVVYDQQEEIIKKKYGKKAAETANYGWGSSESQIETKVYLKSGNMVLVSTFDSDDNPKFPQTINHEWQEY